MFIDSGAAIPRVGLRAHRMATMIHSALAIISTLTVAACLLSVRVDAQNATGTLAGRVSDTANYPLPGVTVEVSATRGKHSVVTNLDGCFRFTDLRPDTYEVF